MKPETIDAIRAALESQIKKCEMNIQRATVRNPFDDTLKPCVDERILSESMRLAQWYTSALEDFMNTDWRSV